MTFRKVAVTPTLCKFAVCSGISAQSPTPSNSLCKFAGCDVELAGTGAPNGIDWDEEIGLPREPTAQLQPQMQGIAAVHDGYDDKRDAIRMLVGSDVLDGPICHIDTADCGIGL